MNLIKSTGTFSFFTTISRILGYIRDILIAIFLGSGPLADAFFVAFRIPNTFRRLFSEGTFNAAFVPSYASEIANGKEQSEKFATNIFSLLILSLFFLVLIIVISEFSTNFAKAKTFEINDIEIKEKYDLNFNKIKVVDKAFKKAFEILISKILQSQNKSILRSIDINQIKSFVEGFSLMEEKFVDDNYQAKINVDFDVQSLFLKKTINTI